MTAATIYTAMAVLGIGGGFAVLAFELRDQLRFERWMRALRRMGIHDLADGMIESRFGCYCSRCRTERTQTAAREVNEDINRRRVATREMIRSLKADILKVHGGG